MTNATYNISVKNLVEFTLRRGDLGSDFAPPNRAVEAIRIHKKIQASRPEGYSPEVVVAFLVECDEVSLKIGGRIDGVFQYPDRVTIDEIKTTYRDLAETEADPNPLHWGQAKVYAHMLAQQRGLSDIDVQLTYYQMETGGIKEIRRSFTREALSEFFDGLVSNYLEWILPVVRWRIDRDESIRAMDFPFDAYRPGQRDMAVRTYLAIKHGERLLVRAPTGIGKTAAAIFPALKALAEGRAKAVVYLTARTTGRLAAEKTLAFMRRKDLKIKSLSLTAKEKLCPVPEMYCRTMECPYAVGYYDRSGSALKEAFRFEALSGETIARIGSDHQVCPFELSLDIAFWVDMVIGDYNYAFDPNVFLKRFFIEYGGNYAFLVDEAHNLVDRGRKMFSAQIQKKPIPSLSRRIKTDLPELTAILKRINKRLIEARKECEKSGGFFSRKECPSDLNKLIAGFQEKAADRLAQGLNPSYAEEFASLYIDFNRFLKTAQGYDERYAACYQKDGNDLKLTLFCLDPSDHLNKALKRAGSSVFFSAALAPMDFYRDLLGCRENASHLILPSPFPPEKLRLLIDDRISTKYRRREQTKEDIAHQINRLVQSRRGNYLVFFPSYEYMRMVHQVFQAVAPGMEIILQEPNMNEKDREAFIHRFDENNPDTLVGLAVMGGIFGEGIDLIGDRLTGAVIVGVGLPAIGPERDLIRSHFNQTRNRGFEYAYLYPGFTRVLQAAGRVIRSEDDKGVVLLIDQRFGSRRYRDLYPHEWRPQVVSDNKRLTAILKEFWSG